MITPTTEVNQGFAALVYAARLIKTIKPSENVRKGDSHLHNAGELLVQYRDNIPAGLLDDVLMAQDLASAVREEYQAAKDKSSFLNVGQRIILAREFKRMARRAYDRSVHVTGLALRNAMEQRVEELVEANLGQGETPATDCEVAELPFLPIAANDGYPGPNVRPLHQENHMNANCCGGVTILQTHGNININAPPGPTPK